MKKKQISKSELKNSHSCVPFIYKLPLPCKVARNRLARW